MEQKYSSIFLPKQFESLTSGLMVEHAIPPDCNALEGLEIRVRTCLKSACASQWKLEESQV